MTLTNRQRTDRLRKRLAELELWTVRSAVALDGWTFNGRPLARGAAWPTREGVALFAHDDVTVPADWPLDAMPVSISTSAARGWSGSPMRGATARRSASIPITSAFR